VHWSRERLKRVGTAELRLDDDASPSREMKSIILHIGQSKTGTTTIQRSCWAQRSLLLGCGVQYLESGVEYSHSPAHYGLLSDYFKLPLPSPNFSLGNRFSECERIWDTALSEIESSTCQKILISCESGWLLDTDAIGYVKGKLDRYAVFIVLVLREPAAYIVSSYKQAIKVGRFLSTFSDFLALRRDLLDYDKPIARWASQFGRENLGIFSYEGLRSRLLENFWQIIGVDGCTDGLITQWGEEGVSANVTPIDGVLLALKTLGQLESRLPKAVARPVRRFRRSLMEDKLPIVNAGLSRLPCTLLCEYDLQLLQTLPTNKAIAFDETRAFACRIAYLSERELSVDCRGT